MNSIGQESELHARPQRAGRISYNILEFTRLSRNPTVFSNG